MTQGYNKIETSKASRGRGPYPQALMAGPFLFMSGQGPLSPESNQPVLGSFAGQVQLTMANVTAILEAADLALTDIVKITVYLSDLDRVGEFNEIYSTYFDEHRPARTLVQAGLRSIDVEFDVIAMNLNGVFPQREAK